MLLRVIRDTVLRRVIFIHAVRQVFPDRIGVRSRFRITQRAELRGLSSLDSLLLILLQRLSAEDERECFVLDALRRPGEYLLRLKLRFTARLVLVRDRQAGFTIVPDSGHSKMSIYIINSDGCRMY